ncbi:MAG TPA: hypothetical protein PLB25_18410 [Rhodoferax sp.]|nr:hypothetical protein [Rhodoferax sp.]
MLAIALPRLSWHTTNSSQATGRTFVHEMPAKTFCCQRPLGARHACRRSWPLFSGLAALQNPACLWIGGPEDGRLQDMQTAPKSGPELDLVIDQDVPPVQLRYLNSPAASL